MSNDFIRLVAGLAAVAVIAAPTVVALAAQAKGWLRSGSVEGGNQKAKAIRLTDMRLVLDLAARLKADDCPEGVSLCQQLLDVMLGNSPKGKK